MEKYSGVPKPYTQSVSVNNIPSANQRYAIPAVAYPPESPHNTTITHGIMIALSKTGNIPPIAIFPIELDIGLPIK